MIRKYTIATRDTSGALPTFNSLYKYILVKKINGKRKITEYYNTGMLAIHSWGRAHFLFYFFQ